MPEHDDRGLATPRSTRLRTTIGLAVATLATGVVTVVLLAQDPSPAGTPAATTPAAPVASDVEAPADPPPGRSPRNANYTIEARLDEAQKVLEGRQTVRWRNLRTTPTDELWFHLYWNAWRNDHSTWMREDRLRGRSSLGDDVRREDWGWLEVETIRLGDIDLMPTWRFTSPDDGNPNDRTVAVVTLPAPVAGGETIEVEVTWRAKIPRTFARTGYQDDFYFIAHWFPKLGVYEESGWSCHQFHSATEFYSDYGVYDVTLDLPNNLVVGATGRQVETTEGDGRARHRFVQEDVHGFAWTASPDYRVHEDRFEVAGLPPVDIRLLMQPDHESQAARHLHATKAALQHYGLWYGPYPYGQITVVDPAYRSGAGGMEYPTLFTCGSRLINPFGGGSPEGVTVHEAGHQFWYGVVGNDEFEHAWLDEGLNTYSTAKVMDEVYGDAATMRTYLTPPGDALGGFVRVLFPELPRTREAYGSRWSRYIASDGPTMDAMAVPTYRAFPPGAGTLSYHKTAMWLQTLERFLGWGTMSLAMSSFYERWAFDHPEPEDFFQALEEANNGDLDWFFDQVYRGEVQFDYAVDRATSQAADVRGFVRTDDGSMAYWDATVPEANDEETARFRSEVVLRRLGGGIFPVEVLLVFEDGTEVRRVWDGASRWHWIVEEGPSRLDYAVVDPDHVLILDLDRTNNSFSLAPGNTLVGRKWGSRWMVWLQDWLTTTTFFL